MKNRIVKILALTLSVLFLASLTACKAKPGPAAAGEKQTIRIGSKDFTENLIVAELYALALEDNGYKVDRKFNLASSAVHTTIVNNGIDLYPEYTGTGLLAVLKHDLVTNPDEVYAIVRDEYKKQFNLVWLPYASANDGQGLVITKKASDEYGIKTISDLQRNVDRLRFASQGEFDLRDDGIPALEAKYGRFNWRSSRVYDNSLKYSVLENDEADVAPAYTTEGALTDPRFVLLVDDKEVWPPYNLAPVVRGEILDANPAIAGILAVVNKALTTEAITALNAKVDLELEEYEDVAKYFYTSVKNR
jgi:osmoprotectant transport system substrate-binding protein